jgi:hypothetical protein
LGVVAWFYTPEALEFGMNMVVSFSNITLDGIRPKRRSRHERGATDEYEKAKIYIFRPVHNAAGQYNDLGDWQLDVAKASSLWPACADVKIQDGWRLCASLGLINEG